MWGGNLLNLNIIDISLPEDGIITHKKIPLPEVVDLIKQSHCILDTDRESQTGTTPRLIWALAMNKKIITTNKNIVNFWFYDPSQILIIDRNNPEISDDFLFSELNENVSQDRIESLRIDKWLDQLITI